MTTAAARPLTAKGTATRARIVAAAAALVYERGVANTSIEEVRAAAGVSASQLYHYFADKRALTLAVISHQVEAVVGTQTELLTRVERLADLRAWRDALVAFTRAQGCTGGCPIGSLASELADADPEARAALDAGFLRWEKVLRDGLIRMRDRGELRADADPAELALATLAACQGGLLLTQARRDAAPLATALDAALAHILSFAA